MNVALTTRVIAKQPMNQQMPVNAKRHLPVIAIYVIATLAIVTQKSVAN